MGTAEVAVRQSSRLTLLKENFARALTLASPQTFCGLAATPRALFSGEGAYLWVAF